MEATEATSVAIQGTGDLSKGAASSVSRGVRRPSCRFCSAALEVTFADLGSTPLCESFISPERLWEMEPTFPLHAWVCEQCWLVQVDAFVAPDDIFTEYAYFSSYSDSWLEHSARYVEMIVEKAGLTSTSQVVEVASNDGYLLKNFVTKGIPALGVEPARNVAAAALEQGVPTRMVFFGLEEAARMTEEGFGADLVIGNNVLAQVPDLHDFVAGMKTLLKPNGLITMEFPHLLRLIEENQFDTIYHEHFSYFSLHTARSIFESHGLRIHDVEELTTHGGSLRIYATHADEAPADSEMVVAVLRAEREGHLLQADTYRAFDAKVRRTKRELLAFLIEIKSKGQEIAGYGAPGKGNTLLNYCGIGTDFVEYTVDRNPHKWGMYTPGTRIPIHPPDRVFETKPDYVLILPWNLRAEIMEQMAGIRDWGGRFVVPIPEVGVHE